MPAPPLQTIMPLSNAAGHLFRWLFVKGPICGPSNAQYRPIATWPATSRSTPVWPRQTTQVRQEMHHFLKSWLILSIRTSRQTTKMSSNSCVSLLAL